MQALIDGTWESQSVWEGIADGAVVIGEMTDAIPAEVRAEAEALADSIAAATCHPFTGPLNKQDGSAWLAAGESQEDGVLLGMNFYVEGLTAEIPELIPAARPVLPAAPEQSFRGRWRGAGRVYLTAARADFVLC